MLLRKELEELPRDYTRIRITKFGVDGPATTAILYFDGNIVIYVVDDTRYPSNKFYTYYGHYITVNYRNYNYNQIIIDYNLITLDGSREMAIFSIWAGIKPQEILNRNEKCF